MEASYSGGNARLVREVRSTNGFPFHEKAGSGHKAGAPKDMHGPGTVDRIVGRAA